LTPSFSPCYKLAVKPLPWCNF